MAPACEVLKDGSRVQKKGVVSIIITCYNYGHFLEACLKSVLRQSYRHLDIVVIDDGSTDNTAQVAMKYRKKINYIYQENKGLSAARNKGIEEATGDYILFLDADDLLGKTSISKRIKYLQLNPKIDIAICKNYFFTEKPVAREKYQLWKLPSEPIDVAFMRFNIAPVHAYLIRSNTIKESIRFNKTLKACEDYDFWLQLLKHKYQFACCEGHVFYRQHATSMSKNLENQWLHDAILHEVVFQKFFSENTASSENTRYLSAFLSGIAVTKKRLSSNHLASTHLQRLTYIVENRLGQLITPVADTDSLKVSDL